MAMDNLTKKYEIKLKILPFLLLFISSVSGFSQSIINDSKGNSSIGLIPEFKTRTDKKESSSIIIYNSNLYQSIINDREGISKADTTGLKEIKEDSPKIDTVIFNLGMVTFTTKDKKLGLNYYSYFTPKKFTDFYVGISSNSKVKNSIANIFSSGNIVAEGEANLKLGFRLYKNKHNWPELLARKRSREEIQEILDNSTRPANDLWLVLDGSFLGSSFKRYAPDSTFTNQIQKENFTGYNINVGLNYWNARIIDYTILAGATIGIKQKNNFDDLTESTREDKNVITDSISGTERKITIKETVYSGDYEESIIYPLNLDLYLVPHNLSNVGILGYSRTEIQKSKKPRTELGVGIFFLKDQNAFNPTAGITFSYGDVFNVDKSDDHRGKLNKFSIAITTRINLVNNQKRKM